MAYDFYGEAEEIAVELEEQSHTMLATLVRKDVSGGSTATEILMALRHDLSPASRDTDVAPSTRSRIGQLLAHIDDALAP